jgi:hypothetical protein
MREQTRGGLRGKGCRESGHGRAATVANAVATVAAKNAG